MFSYDELCNYVIFHRIMLWWLFKQRRLVWIRIRIAARNGGHRCGRRLRFWRLRFARRCGRQVRIHRFASRMLDANTESGHFWTIIIRLVRDYRDCCAVLTDTRDGPDSARTSRADRPNPSPARWPNAPSCATLAWPASWTQRNSTAPVVREFDRSSSAPCVRPIDGWCRRLQRQCCKIMCVQCIEKKYDMPTKALPCPSLGSRGQRHTIARWWCSYLAWPDVTSISDSCSWSTVPRMRSMPLILPVRRWADLTEPYLSGWKINVDWTMKDINYTN